MKKLVVRAIFLLMLLPFLIKAQPFIDIGNVNAQVFRVKYKDSLQTKSLVSTYNGTLFFLKKFANDNMFLLRLSGEVIQIGKREKY